MAGGKLDQGLGRNLLIVGNLQVLDRHFRAGGLLVTSGHAVLAKNLLGENPGILPITVTAEDHDHAFSMDPGDDHPGKLIHVVQKIGDNHQDVRGPHPADMDEGLSLAHLQLVQGYFEIFQLGTAKIGQLQLAHQVQVGKAEQVAEGDAVGRQGILLEILGIDLDPVEQGRGQRHRGFDVGGAQVFHHDGRRRPVGGPDVNELGIPLNSDRMVVDDRIKVHLFKTGQVRRLRVEQDLLGVIADFQGMQPLDGNLQPLDHLQVIEPPDLVGVPDSDILNPVAEQPFYRHGGGQCIGVGIDDHQNIIVLAEHLPEPVQPGNRRIPALASGNGIGDLF